MLFQQRTATSDVTCMHVLKSCLAGSPNSRPAQGRPACANQLDSDMQYTGNEFATCKKFPRRARSCAVHVPCAIQHGRWARLASGRVKVCRSCGLNLSANVATEKHLKDAPKLPWFRYAMSGSSINSASRAAWPGCTFKPRSRTSSCGCPWLRSTMDECRHGLCQEAAEVDTCLTKACLELGEQRALRRSVLLRHA